MVDDRRLKFEVEYLTKQQGILNQQLQERYGEIDELYKESDDLKEKLNHYRTTLDIPAIEQQKVALEAIYEWTVKARSHMERLWLTFADQYACNICRQQSKQLTELKCTHVFCLECIL